MNVHRSSNRLHSEHSPINKQQLKTLVLFPTLAIVCCLDWLSSHFLIRLILVVNVLPLNTVQSTYQVPVNKQ